MEERLRKRSQREHISLSLLARTFENYTDLVRGLTVQYLSGLV